MMNVAELRQEYMRAGLSEVDADRDPVRQFEHWLEDALRARLPLPNAATLATVSEAGTPAARAVLLKGIERGGFAFYTNYRSRQGRADRPHDRLLYTRGGGGWRIERLAP